LLQKWNEGWSRLFKTMEGLTDGDLDKAVTIRNEKHTVLEAINRQLTHYPFHIGQIVYLGKYFKKEKWRSLSVPKGKSAEYNEKMFSDNKK
jgi:hypothetical protein